MLHRIPSLSVAQSTSTSLRAAAPARYVNPRATQSSASFSTTASRPYITRHRREFVKWLKGPGVAYKHPKPDGGPNYITKGKGATIRRPFPLNPEFRSDPVLDDQARQLIWKDIMREGQTIKAVSAKYGVDINRVSAIVRLKEVEKDWQSKGKSLATPYQKAVLGMLPTRTLRPDTQNQPFENINEVHIHSHTMKQIFWPTSESRQFTREDAAAAFHRKMYSTDKRVPHPELIQMEKDILAGKTETEARNAFISAVEAAEREAAQKVVDQAVAEDKATTRVPTKRFEFRFREIDSENVGPKGRNKDAVGARYGRPSYDRVKGLVRHPTSVP